LFQEKCEQLPERVCPACGSRNLIKTGSIHNGKPKHQCKNCGRQFVVNPTKTTVSEEIKQFIDRLLLERISLRGIARVTQVSWSWRQDYVNQRLAHTPRQVEVSEKSSHRLTIECDEMWSFVDSKKNEIYIGLAIDRNSRKIVGCLWEIELGNQLVNYGLLYQRFISNVPLLIQIFGKLTKQLFSMNVTAVLANKRVKLIILNG
jgi:transposase-like protein